MPFHQDKTNFDKKILAGINSQKFGTVVTSKIV